MAYLFFERIGPTVCNVLNWKIDATAFAQLALRHVNHESISADGADATGRYSRICCTAQQQVRVIRPDREDDARRTFSEQQGVPPQRTELQFYHSASAYARTRHAAFRQRNSETPVRAVVRRFDKPFTNHC